MLHNPIKVLLDIVHFGTRTERIDSDNSGQVRGVTSIEDAVHHLTKVRNINAGI